MSNIAQDSYSLKRVFNLILAFFAIATALALCSAFIWISIANNWHPPRMFSQLFASGGHQNQTVPDAAITEVLQRTFPSGIAVSDLKASLSKEGFQDVPPPPSDCIPSDKEPEVASRTIYTPCYDTRNHMEYRWVIGLICGGHIYVKWLPSDDGKVIRIEGYNSTACL